VSELQIALLVIAGVVLAGLYLAGKWQERRLLRRLSEQFSGDVGDALLDDVVRTRAQSSSSAVGAGRGRVEPRLDFDAPDHPGDAADGADYPEQASAAAARRSDWIEDPMLDCVLELRCARPVDGVSFIEAAMPLASAQWTMPVWFVVWDARAQHWVQPDRFGYYTDALAAIQLANRRRVLSEEQIERFVAAVRTAAALLDADCDPPDVVRMAASALELDRMCARFDVRIGLTLESSSGPWTEARIEAAAAQVGLESAGALRWAPPHESGPAPLTVSMQEKVSERVFLELDVPATPPGGGAVRQLFSLGGQLGALLNARLVDDNGHPIDAQSVSAIESQLGKLYDDMRRAGIDPGGDRARRLYV
jgi:hypothetical protein